MSEMAKKLVKKKKHRIFKKMKTIIKWIVILIVLLIAALFALKAAITKRAESSEDAESYSTALVQRGAMEATVYGTGTTSARSQPNVLAQADGTLTELHVSVGDEVKAGDILAVLTNDTLDDTITDLEFALWELDEQIADTRAGSKVTTIEAPVAGRVMALYANVGDDALAVFRREGALAIISTDGRMKVELSGDTVLGVALNDTVTLTGETFETTGTVTDLTRQGTHATITVIGDTYPMDETVAVTDAEGTTLGSGVMEINKPMAVSSYGGTIKRVVVNVGDTVSRLDTIYTLEDSPLTLTVENLRLQRETAAKELSDAKDQRENLVVVAPCDGVIATVDVAEGDEISAGSLMMSILQGEAMNLTIAVDELDVVNVEAGQKVTITVDAFSDAEYTGEVSKIAPVGTNSGGVTTYDVELAFESEGTGVRSGMNATGEITIDSKSDTLYVPIEAIMTINDETYVMVAGGTQTMDLSSFSGGQRGDRGRGEDAEQTGEISDKGGMPGMSDMGEMPDMSNMPDMNGMKQENSGDTSKIKFLISAVRAWLYDGVDSGATQMTGTLTKVTVGMENDDYAEILDGLSEGDVVLYTGSSDSSASMFGNFGGGGNRGGDFGGMGGGMPMGGF